MASSKGATPSRLGEDSDWVLNLECRGPH